MKLFCKHIWKVITEKELKSPYEKLTKIEMTGGALPTWFFRSKYICIIQCVKCGKLNKTEKTNP